MINKNRLQVVTGDFLRSTKEKALTGFLFTSALLVVGAGPAAGQTGEVVDTLTRIGLGVLALAVLGGVLWAVMKGRTGAAAQAKRPEDTQSPKGKIYK